MYQSSLVLTLSHLISVRTLFLCWQRLPAHRSKYPSPRDFQYVYNLRRPCPESVLRSCLGPGLVFYMFFSSHGRPKRIVVG